MATWSFEPGHTEAAFRARHMMVTWVRGLFKDIHGRMEWDREDPLSTIFGGAIDARKLWTGEPERDAHLRSRDFFDVEREPTIAFDGRFTERVGDTHFKALVELTIRGVTRDVALNVAYLGQWEIPYWVSDENRGSMRRIGFEARTVLNRHDFGVSWQDETPGGGVVVSNEIALTSISRRLTTMIYGGWESRRRSMSRGSSRLRRARAVRMRARSRHGTHQGQ